MFVFSLVVLYLGACVPTPPPTPFIPPRAAPPTSLSVRGEAPLIPTFTPPPEPSPTPTALSPCTDGLAFIEDLTIPDGTVLSPGVSIDKQWRVQNSGTCNWDARYRLKFVGGLEMGAATEHTLYPARAGTQANLQITFIAPFEPGNYTTAWQAFEPNGEPFGDAIYMEIIVQ